MSRPIPDKPVIKCNSVDGAASEYAKRITVLWEKGQAARRQAFDAAIEVGRLLNEAKTTLPHGQFEHMVRENLPFAARHAQRLMRVVSHRVLANATPESLLPPSVTTQYELSKLADETLETMISDGRVRPDITRAEAAKLVRREQQKTNVDRIRANAGKHALRGEYLIGIADCPWRYTEEPTGDAREVESHYPTEDVEYLKNFRVDDGRHVSEVFAKNSIIFFWTTDRHLWSGSTKAVLDAWGFERRGNMVWSKPQIGLGTFARNQHEQLIIGVRGRFSSPEPHLRNSTVFAGAPWCNEHSAKPTRLYELIERSYPGVRPRLELFARQYREGWDGQGFEYAGPPSLRLGSAASDSIDVFHVGPRAAKREGRMTKQLIDQRQAANLKERRLCDDAPMIVGPAEAARVDAAPPTQPGQEELQAEERNPRSEMVKVQRMEERQ